MGFDELLLGRLCPPAQVLLVSSISECGCSIQLMCILFYQSSNGQSPALMTVSCDLLGFIPNTVAFGRVSFLS